MGRRRADDPDIAGVLVVDKPAGMTSHDVVSHVRRGLDMRRVGHTGTLDPAATGVLVVAVGRATRLVPYLQAGRKTYAATMVLGRETDSQDADGDVIAEADTSHLVEDDVCRALKHYVGDIEQIPPMVSAVKVDGERLHAKARRGEVVERDPRPVTIHELVLEEFVPGDKATASFLVTCSAGTYVRTLAHDVGARLEVGGSLTALRRLANGAFSADEAVSLDDVDALGVEALRARLLTPDEALRGFTRVDVDDERLGALVNGGRLPEQGITGPYVAVSSAGVVGVYEDVDGVGRAQVVLLRPEDLADE